MQVLTRRQQLDAKKNNKGDQEDEPKEDETKDEAEQPGSDDEPQEVMKRPASRKAGKEKTQPKAKAKGKAKCKAKASPKRKASPKKAPKSRGRKSKEGKGAEDQEDEKDEEEEPTPERKDLSKEFKHAAQGKTDPPKPEQKPKRKARKSKNKNKNKEAEQGQGSAEGDAEPPKTRRPRKSKKEDQGNQGDDAEEPQSKKKTRKSRRAPPPELMNQVDVMYDKVMVGVITQTLKEVKSMTVDELKDYLCNKKLDLPNDKCELNVYWTQTASAVRFKLIPSKPDSSRFSYKIGTWNTRMAAAFISSYLMVA